MRRASSPSLLEGGAWLVGIATLFVFLHAPLWQGTAVLAHDNFAWAYPSFHYVARCLWSGELPLWNPFSHAGEPFYPILVQTRLLEPLTLIVIFVGRFFTEDTTILFNWNRVLLALLSAIGIGLALRPYAKSLFTRLLLVPVLLFSSILLSTFRQDGTLEQFLWIPFAWLAFRRGHWALLGISVGLSFQSYFFSGMLLFMGTALVAVWAFHPFALPRSSGGWATALGCALLMAAPNLVLFAESGRYVYPMRMSPFVRVAAEDLSNTRRFYYPGEPGPERIAHDRLQLDYETLRATGAPAKWSDLLQMAVPFGNPLFHQVSTLPTWGQPSEAYLYFGLIPLLLIFAGIFRGRDGEKRVWAALALSMLVLMLGPNTPLYRVLFAVLPPLWFMRHTQCLVLLFAFPLLYFFVLGCERLASQKLVVKFLLAALVIGDLLFQFHQTRYVFEGQPSASVVLGQAATLGPPTLQSRKVNRTLPPRLFPHGVQDQSEYLHYSAALRGEPHLFSEPWFTKGTPAGVEQDLASARDNPRRFSFLLSKRYFELIHSALSPSELASVFAIHSSLLVLSGEGYAHVLRYRHNALDVGVDVPEGGTLRWADGYDPSWMAYENGRALPLSESPTFGKEITLPPGRHKIYFRFQPRWFLAALFLFYVPITFFIAHLLRLAVMTFRIPRAIPNRCPTSP